MIRVFLAVLSGVLLFSCSKTEKEESTELNRILNAVLKNESARRESAHLQYTINKELQPLAVYVPTAKEISGEEPGPSSFSSISIVRILDLNHSRPEDRESDSLYLLKQKQYLFDSIPLDKTINPDIRLAGKKEADQRNRIYQFSNPLYLNEHTVYIESIFFDTSFGIGFGYLLEKQEDGRWTVKKMINTFIT
uniref:Lipoprotein n=1 Tax=Chryseobacterium endophyticum TaxID=1854762 RepID=A0AAU6WPJ4_9FLAO